MTKGSFTVEAALCMPIFLVAVLLCIYINKIMTCQDDVQWALDSIAKELSIETATAGIEQIENPVIYSARMDAYVKESYGKISFSNSKYDKKTGDISLVAKYRIKLPFSLLFIKSVPVTQKVKTRAFIGVESRGGEKQEDEEVYITKTGKVYHKDINCTYLKLSISQVLFSDIKNLRNESGGKYKPCKTCVKGVISDSQAVFITNYGDSYHISKTCSGIKRTIQTIKLSQVGKRLPCSKCGK